MPVTATWNIDRLIADLDCVSSHPAAEVHRLSRALTRSAGMPDVARTILRHVIGALRSCGAAFAVQGPQSFAIVATYGEARRATAALHAAINSGAPGATPGIGEHVLIQPITAGGAMLAIASVADRLDNRPFTRADLAVLEALSAPAALALERETLRARTDVLARAATIDPLSGLFNRRHFHTRLEEEVQRAQRHDTKIALLMIDLDDFKRVNDTHGHPAGDVTIRAAASAISRSVRHFDVCTRYGGEEFAVLMPDSDLTTASIVAERIRSRIAAWRAPGIQLSGLRITASVGVALSDRLMTSDMLLAKADAALYEAKASGKDCVRTAR